MSEINAFNSASSNNSALPSHSAFSKDHGLSHCRTSPNDRLSPHHGVVPNETGLTNDSAFGNEISVIVADDSPESYAELAKLLLNAPRVRVLGHVTRPAKIRDAVAHYRPDVVLLDSAMKGLDLAGTIEMITDPQAPSRAAVMILTSTGAFRRMSIGQEFRLAIAVGATSYLLKERAHRGLAEAVRQTAAGWSVVDPDVMRLVIDRRVAGREDIDIRESRQMILNALTPRELDILALLGRGMSNDEICTYFGSALSTVKNHVGAILRKIGVRNRIQAAFIARELGLKPAQGPVDQTASQVISETNF